MVILLSNDLAVKLLAQLQVDFSDIEKKRKQIQEKLKGIDVGIDTSSFKDIQKELLSVTTKFDEMGSTIQTVKKYSTELGAVTATFGKEGQLETAKLTENVAELGTTTQQTTSLLEQMGQVVVAIGIAKIAKQMATALMYAAEQAKIFEEALAGLQRTSFASQSQMAEWEAEILQLSNTLPFAATEIAKVAMEANRLGIAEENVMSFTKTMLDLGVATTMSADYAATNLARFANITQMSQGDFDRLGSSISLLGNNVAATETEIVRMGVRVAAAGAQANMSEADIMGLAAAMSALALPAYNHRPFDVNPEAQGCAA